MDGFKDRDKALFPLKNIATVIQIFKNQLEISPEPDLALLSIISGAIENSLTCRSGESIRVCEPVERTSLPILQLHTVEELYAKFHMIMKNAVEPNHKTKKYATRELVKKVSDVVWNYLTRSYYKDKAHLQSLYSYLTGNKLDCFGVAFAVVAGCQALGYPDVHLALSEDHAWVVFGENGSQTAEVTWHGKGNEDKRGQEIGKGVSTRSWLYVNNKPVVCTRHMEVAALVSAINPSLNATHDAYEVAVLQQELLWLLYDLGHLRMYPMAIGNLGDLEEISPSVGRTPCGRLFEEAIQSARTYYNNEHVYPYTYQGGYFYRNQKYEEAFESWANASNVIRRYNYSRDDEEIYKEFLEIANDLIPFIMKVESSGFSSTSILKKPSCFANLLRFYDGICQWEEDSATPVLHIGWAKPLVNTISKFDADVRARVNIVCDDPSRGGGDDTRLKSNGNCLNNNNYCLSQKENESTDVQCKPFKEYNMTSFHPSIEALTAACSEKILNPGYLLQGDGSPFVGGDDDLPLEKLTGGKPSTSGSGPSKLDTPAPPPVPLVSPTPTPEETDADAKMVKESDGETEKKETSPYGGKMTIILRSQKMKQLKDLLMAEKLNTHAISLHLTAQSQVQISKKGRGEMDTPRPKRTRRD